MHHSPSLEQIFALGLATASALLSEKSSAQLTLRSFRARLAADFPDAGEADHVDVAAGVAQRFRGALRGTSVFTMEPEGALAWARSVEPANEPERVIATFVDLGSRVLGDVVSAVAQAIHDAKVEFDAASLQESSRVAIVIATHAPSDTAVVTLGLDVEFDGVAHTAQLDLLLEPKLLAGYWAVPEAE